MAKVMRSRDMISLTIARSSPHPVKSHPELGDVGEEVERLGIGECFLVLDRPSVDHVTHSNLGDFARLGAWNVGDRDDFCRNMARRCTTADERLYLADQNVI